MFSIISARNSSHFLQFFWTAWFSGHLFSIDLFSCTFLIWFCLRGTVEASSWTFLTGSIRCLWHNLGQFRNKWVQNEKWMRSIPIEINIYVQNKCSERRNFQKKRIRLDIFDTLKSCWNIFYLEIQLEFSPETNFIQKELRKIAECIIKTKSTFVKQKWQVGRRLTEQSKQKT